MPMLSNTCKNVIKAVIYIDLIVKKQKSTVQGKLQRIEDM